MVLENYPYNSSSYLMCDQKLNYLRNTTGHGL